MFKAVCSLTITLLFAAAIAAADAGPNETWLVELEARDLGPVRFELDVSVSEERIRASTRSGLLSFDASQQDDGTYRGQVLAPANGGKIQFEIADDTITGDVDAGSIFGRFQATRGDTASEVRDYTRLLDDFDAVVAANIYAPEALNSTEYRAFREALQQVAASANDDLDLLLGFRSAWGDGAFSHFGMRRSGQSVADIVAYLDTMRVGFEAATVEFEDDIAILKVRTMMGADTIEQIQAAYEQISVNQPATLIVDLRGNNGGAFAVKPLVEHIIDDPMTAGYFLSQNWNRKNDTLPTDAQVLATAPWQGWSIIDFWRSVKERGLLRVQFNPAEPNFDGQIFVLLDKWAASATEMAADALSASGLVTVIGEPSAGEMLSQSMFDLGDGFVMSLPVADYYSFANGRIEGTGVAVDVQANPDEALEIAKRMAR